MKATKINKIKLHGVYLSVQTERPSHSFIISCIFFIGFSLSKSFGLIIAQVTLPLKQFTLKVKAKNCSLIQDLNSGLLTF